jgi:prephenate dehydrogenase
MSCTAVVGVIGSHGAYGRWLVRFFGERMGCRVLGADPADPASSSMAELIAHCEVLVFAAPIAATPDLIRAYAECAGPRARSQLWIDLCSVKAQPMAALAESGAEFLGLHPMCAPPKGPDLRGRVLVCCEGRIERWRGFVDAIYAALDARCISAAPEHHDRIMALVQALVHAGHLAQAQVLAELAPALGGPEALFGFRSASFEMDLAMVERILAGNAEVYAGIQFDNPAVPAVLGRLRAALERLIAQVEAGPGARAQFVRDFFEAPRAAFAPAELARGDHAFEQLGYLLADLAHEGALSVHLPEDRPGALRALLEVFEDRGINLASIHSSRTPAGEVHFRFSFAPIPQAEALAELAAAIESAGIGRPLELT